jgi:hypothetical protein
MIFVKELYSLVATFLTFGHHFKSLHVIAFCDNANACFAIRRQHSRAESKLIMHLLRVLFSYAAIQGFDVHVEQISSKANDVADMISRTPLDRIRAEFANICTTEVVPTLPPEIESENWETEYSELLHAKLRDSESLKI